MNTLSEKKSLHGIEYVKQMLNAVENSTTNKETASNNGLLKTMLFSKRKNQEKEIKKTQVVVNPRHTTSSGEELHKKAKRLNTTKNLIDSGTEAGTSSSGTATDTQKPKRRVKATKNQTGSSTEQMLKKPKRDEKKETSSRLLVEAETAEKKVVPKTSKLKFLSKFENNSDSGTQFSLPVVVCALPKKSELKTTLSEPENKEIKKKRVSKKKENKTSESDIKNKKEKTVKETQKATKETQEGADTVCAPKKITEELPKNNEELKKKLRKKNEIKTSKVILKLDDSNTLPLKLENKTITEERTIVKKQINRKELEIGEINKKFEKLSENISTKNSVKVTSRASKINQNNSLRRRSRSVANGVLKASQETSVKSDTENQKNDGIEKKKIEKKTKTDFKNRQNIFENNDNQPLQLFNVQFNLTNKNEQQNNEIIKNKTMILSKKESKNSNKISCLLNNNQKEEITTIIQTKINEENQIKKKVLF